MKTVTREYRGYVIVSFNLRQLGDRETSGRTYSVYSSQADLKNGADALSCRENLCRLSEAKAFVDATIQAEGSAQAKEFGDYRSNEEMAAHYGEGRA